MRFFLIYFACSFAIKSNAQLISKTYSNCDTIRVRGYIVCMTEYCKKTKKYETYYGFCNSNDVLNDTMFHTIASRYFKSSSEIVNDKKLMPISKKDFLEIKSRITRALYRTSSAGASRISEICDTSLRNFVYNFVYNREPINPRLELPALNSYCFKYKSSRLKPMINIEPMILTCIEVIYPSFQSYYNAELRPEIFSHPLSFCAGFYKYEIEVKEVNNKNINDTKYHVLLPVVRYAN